MVELKIEIEQMAWGRWRGRVIEGWSIEHEVESLDREKVLQKLVCMMGIDLVYKCTHHITGEAVVWKVDK